MRHYICTLLLLLLASTAFGQNSGATDSKSTSGEEDSASRGLHAIFQIEKQVEKNERILADLEKQRTAVNVISRDVQSGLRDLSRIKEELPQLRSERNGLKQQFRAIDVPEGAITGGYGIRNGNSSPGTTPSSSGGSGSVDPPGDPVPPPIEGPSPPSTPPNGGPPPGGSDAMARAAVPIVAVAASLIYQQEVESAEDTPADVEPAKVDPEANGEPRGEAQGNPTEEEAEPSDSSSRQSDQPSVVELRGILGQANSLESRVYSTSFDLDVSLSGFRTARHTLAYIAGGRFEAEGSSYPESGSESSVPLTASAAYYHFMVEQTLGAIDSGITQIERSYARTEQLGIEVEAEIARILSETSEKEARTTSDQFRLQEDLRLAYERVTERKGIDDYLSYAVIAMIVAMVLLYVSLMAFGERLAETIIEQRVLLELLSMGFLLLTIIILGTGRLLTIESLAALLGTIAGYIFGQKTSGEGEEE